MRGTLVRTPAARSLRLISSRGDAVRTAASVGSALAVMVACIPVAVYIWIAAHRLGYPYELDWLEGGAVEQVARVLEGRPLFTAPTLAYVSYTYPPLYTWVSAAVAELTGVGFLPLRLVSLVSSLAAFAALWRWVLATTADRVAGVVAAGMFAAGYGLSGWWFDVGRLDSLFIALTLAALWLGRRATGLQGGLAVGVVAFLAFFTKQIALVALVPALVWLALARPRAGIPALAVLVVCVAASTLLLDALSDGWYRYFVISELAGQPWQRRMWVGFWRLDLYRHLRPLAWLCAAAVVTGACVTWLPRWRQLTALRPSRRLIDPPWVRGLGLGYELAAVTGLLLAAWFSRLHTGGYVNVLVPAYAGCALLGGLAFARLRALGPLTSLLAVALLLAQFVQLLELPNDASPAKVQRTAGAELMSALRSLPGPVLILNHPWYGTLAGRGSFAQADAITEVLRSSGARGAVDLRRALRGALDRYHIQTVVLDKPPPSWLAPQLAAEFVLQPHPVTALPLRPPGDLRGAPMDLYLRRHPG